jgi:hypothetical protein
MFSESQRSWRCLGAEAANKGHRIFNRNLDTAGLSSHKLINLSKFK